MQRFSYILKCHSTYWTCLTFKHKQNYTKSAIQKILHFTVTYTHRRAHLENYFFLFCAMKRSCPNIYTNTKPQMQYIWIYTWMSILKLKTTIPNVVSVIFNCLTCGIPITFTEFLHFNHSRSFYSFLFYSNKILLIFRSVNLLIGNLIDRGEIATCWEARRGEARGVH